MPLTKAALTKAQKLYFRDQLRVARYAALKDAEGYTELLYVFERLGSFLKEAIGTGLGAYESVLKELAKESYIAERIPQEEEYRQLHTPFSKLFTIVREGRNAALHQGAYARHLTQHAIELSIILEDALMNDEVKVCDFMVRNPITASPWHPVSFIQQTLLTNSFSYLPIKVKIKEKENGKEKYVEEEVEEEGEEKWRLVSDYVIAKYLRKVRGSHDYKQRQITRLVKACNAGDIKLIEANCVPADTPLSDIIDPLENGPILITKGNSKELIGILTSFDLL